MQVNRFYTGRAAQEIDRIAIEEKGYSGFSLMNQAGEAAFSWLQTRHASLLNNGQVLVLCGSGNNGGDGYIVARCAIQAGLDVALLAISEPRSDTAQQARDEFLSVGGTVKNWRDEQPSSSYTVIVDALLGTGLQTAPRGDYAEAIRWANRLIGFKFALDVPSGVDADTGECFEPCFRADATMTFIVPKIGLSTGAALNQVGEITLDTLSIDQEIYQHVAQSAQLIEPFTPNKRKRDSHKGIYGHAVVAGGAAGMLGAVLLAGEAALRLGAGKVTVLCSEQNLDKPALHQPELMSAAFSIGGIPQSLQTATAVAVGPGLGQGEWGQALLDSVVRLDLPKVIDADALTLLASRADSTLSSAVLTPHPGEAATLLACSTRKIQGHRVAAAQAIASKYRAVCVLKGAGSLVADPQGDTWLCDRGNPAMATAGMGDVLTGMVAALLANGFTPIEAAKRAVFMHAHAADVLVGSGFRTLLASDVARHLSVL